MTDFAGRLRASAAAARSLVCVGLDVDAARLPASVSDAAEFNRAIVGATADLACAYKPNLAFYEALGMPGLRALEATVAHIRQAAAHCMVIGDAKRGDIGSSAAAYAAAMFDGWGFDAVTINPWGGMDTVEPWLGWPERGVFIWCRGSNPGAGDWQDLPAGASGEPLYLQMARRAEERASLTGASPTRASLTGASPTGTSLTGASLAGASPTGASPIGASLEDGGGGSLGLVVGATAPEQLAAIREVCPDMPLLIPGVGAQGGDLEATVRYGVDAAGRNAIINSSRGIIYASSGVDYAAAARRATLALRDAINATLDDMGLGWQ